MLPLGLLLAGLGWAPQGDIRVNQFVSGAQNETSLAVSATDPGHWVGVANDYRLGSPRAGWYTTLNGGGTWFTGTFPLDAGFLWAGDPAVALAADQPLAVCIQYDGPGGVERLKAYRSTTGGVTWDGGTSIGDQDGFDKPQVAVDTSGLRVAVVWNVFKPGQTDVLVSVSSDGGATWSPPQAIDDAGAVDTLGPDAAWGPAGELYVLWADRGARRVVLDRSLDGGVTFGTDRVVADFNPVPSPLPGSTFRVLDVFALQADATAGPYSGRLYAAFHSWGPGTGEGLADVLVAHSSDRGDSWSPPIRVSSETGASDQVMAGVDVDANGSVHVAYFDQRGDPADDLLRTWLARSADGGQTWKEQPVSDIAWDAGPTEFSGTFIGDYLDVASGAGRVLPFWTDGRSGGQDVYTDPLRLELRADGSDLSAASGGSLVFTLELGPNRAGESFLLLAGGAGSAPGTTVPGGVHVPLNPDFWTDLTLALQGSPHWVGSPGSLGPGGTASVTVDTLGPFPSTFAGTQLDFVAVTFDALLQIQYATAPTPISLVP